MPSESIHAFWTSFLSPFIQNICDTHRKKWIIVKMKTFIWFLLQLCAFWVCLYWLNTYRERLCPNLIGTFAVLPRSAFLTMLKKILSKVWCCHYRVLVYSVSSQPYRLLDPLQTGSLLCFCLPLPHQPVRLSVNRDSIWSLDLGSSSSFSDQRPRHQPCSFSRSPHLCTLKPCFSRSPYDAEICSMRC